MWLYKKIVDIEDIEYLIPIGSEVFTWNLFVWSTASSIDFQNAQAIFSQGNSWVTSSYNTWIISEWVATAWDTARRGVWLYWIGLTNSATEWRWLIWDARVTATWDTGTAIWVEATAVTTHAGGLNIWLYARAVNWASNYSLYMDWGDIFSATAQTWNLALNLDLTKTVRITWRSNPTSGTWLEFIYDTNVWSILTFNRTWWTYKDLSLNAGWIYISGSSTGNVWIWTSTITASAKLQIVSTTQWFLPPVMTTTQKNAISTPAAWLIVYDSTLNKICFKWAVGWETVTSA